MAVGTFFVLDRIRPVYLSQATILIETGESDLTRSDGGRTDTILDQEAIASQVQLIRSRDLAKTVSKELELASRAEFDPVLAEPSVLDTWLARFGLVSRRGDSTIEERVLKAYYKKLSVYAVGESRVISVDFSSTDPELAAAAANAIAKGYINLQREAKRETTTDAAEWLSTQIIDLRTKVMDAEARVETFRAGNDLFSTGGQTPTTLPDQQLADLNGELTRVRAERANAETKAAQIRVALEAGTTPNVTDVLNSQLIQRLVEQQVALRSQKAQLAATLLPQHPRMKELSAQIADLDRQIAAEARKILDSLEAEAGLAGAREEEISRGLGDLKSVAARANDAAVELRALEREAAAQRDLLDSYLRRYREALAREQSDYQPADARIISRAAPSSEPDFPRKVPMTAIATVAALIAGIAIILLRELASGRPMRRIGFAGTLPAVPGAVPADGHMRWADDHSARRMMPGEPTLAPALVDRVEESVAAIAGEIGDGDAKRILVTLAEGCETDGRPVAAVALARVLARTEARVVVVDFRGDDANAISMGEEEGDLPGFAELFDGKASFAQVIFRDRSSRVHFIPAGRTPLTPAALADERVETVLSALTLTYDYVILDVPDPMIPVAGPGSGVAVVVSHYGAADPRTRSAFERVKAVTDAKIQLLVVDAARDKAAAEAFETVERARDNAPAGEAA